MFDWVALKVGGCNTEKIIKDGCWLDYVADSIYVRAQRLKERFKSISNEHIVLRSKR